MFSKILVQNASSTKTNMFANSIPLLALKSRELHWYLPKTAENGLENLHTLLHTRNMNRERSQGDWVANWCHASAVSNKERPVDICILFAKNAKYFAPEEFRNFKPKLKHNNDGDWLRKLWLQRISGIHLSKLSQSTSTSPSYRLFAYFVYQMLQQKTKEKAQVPCVWLLHGKWRQALRFLLVKALWNPQNELHKRLWNGCYGRWTWTSFNPRMSNYFRSLFKHGLFQESSKERFTTAPQSLWLQGFGLWELWV